MRSCFIAEPARWATEGNWVGLPAHAHPCWQCYWSRARRGGESAGKRAHSKRFAFTKGFCPWLCRPWEKKALASRRTPNRFAFSQPGFATCGIVEYSAFFAVINDFETFDAGDRPGPGCGIATDLWAAQAR